MPKVLRLAVRMGSEKNEDEIALPDDWDEMSPVVQEEWADDALRDHVSNHIDSWYSVEDS